MLELAICRRKEIPPMSAAGVDQVRKLDMILRPLPQVDIETDHVIHAGVYARTIEIKAGTVLTGALIKIATTLIVSGDCVVYVDGEAIELRGYHVLAAAAGRKQAFVARGDTWLTMLFATKAKSVLQAEQEFTDESAQLFSRRPECRNSITITEE